MAHLEAYLRTWAAKGTVDKQILAHFKLGEHLLETLLPARRASRAPASPSNVLSTTARQRAFDEINRSRRGGKRKVKEKASNQCGPLSRSKITCCPARPATRGPPSSTSPPCCGCTRVGRR